MQKSKKLVNAVLAEDRLADISLTKRILEFENVQMHLDVVRDGEELIAFLCDKARSQVPAADIIFLDLNLQKIHGKDILKKLKNDAELSSIPIVVLSGSDNDADIIETKELGAEAYIIKPIGLEKMREAFQDNVNFSFETQGNEVYFYRNAG